jgi:hypothetical protein
MQISWMLFDLKTNVDIRFTNSQGIEILGMVSYFHKKYPYIFWEEFYRFGDMVKDIRYTLSVKEIEVIEQEICQALKHPLNPNEYCLNKYYKECID